MKVRTLFPCIAMSFAVFTISPQISAQAETFGSGTNTFDINFVNIGNTDNAADTTGYGAVPYAYRMGTYEISQDIITKATASGMANVTAGAWSGSQPAASITWYEAAAFVNWLNTSTGHQAAYNLTFSGSWSMTLWSSGDAWTAGGTNLYRHKDAYYFLPSENEWYKAAYYNAVGTNYYLYPTGSDTAPTAVGSGTSAGTAVYNQPIAQGPAIVDSAGGSSPYGTMGQGGNVWEWIETSYDGANDSSSEVRTIRSALFIDSELGIRSSHRNFYAPADEFWSIGIRLASVPEPSTYALLAMSAAGALWWARRRR